MSKSNTASASQSLRNASLWSIDWWRKRHDQVYFPAMDWHKDWKVCPYPPPRFIELICPTKDDVVLEIGCGYGEWMVPLSPHVGELRGIDIHTDLLYKALEKFTEHKADNCDFRLCNGLDIPYGDDTFTIVYSVSVFQHIPRATVRRYFEETDRVLIPGGKYLFHFRRDDDIGDYSRDILVDHTGDFSTGWTPEEASAEAARLGWSHNFIADDNHSLFLYGSKP